MKLIFVYNADSSLFSQLTDYAHKLISPSTYQCNLCALTYGNVGMKNQWKEFVKSLNVNSEFLHKDEFENKYNYSIDYPVVLKYDSKISVLISADQLKKLRSLKKLISSVKNKLKP